MSSDCWTYEEKKPWILVEIFRLLSFGQAYWASTSTHPIGLTEGAQGREGEGCRKLLRLSYVIFCSRVPRLPIGYRRIQNKIDVSSAILGGFFHQCMLPNIITFVSFHWDYSYDRTWNNTWFISWIDEARTSRHLKEKKESKLNEKEIIEKVNQKVSTLLALKQYLP